MTDVDLSSSVTTDLAHPNTTAAPRARNEPGGSNNFFDVYYSPHRFRLEITLAILGCVCNSLVPVFVNFDRRRRHHSRRFSLYNILFINLSVSNALSCLINWTGNNLLFMFGRYLGEIQRRNVCAFFVILLGTVYVTVAFSVVGTLTTLGFSVVQYLAICRPLRGQLTVLRRRNAYNFIATSWALTLTGSMIPLVAVIVVVGGQPCQLSIIRWIVKVVHVSANITATILAIIYLIIVFICVKIYQKICSVRRLVSRFRVDSDISRSDRRAFFTIFILVLTLSVSIVPCLVIHVLSLNVPNSKLLHEPIIIYFMNTVLYLKYISDPVVYGLRMGKPKRAIPEDTSSRTGLVNKINFCCNRCRFSAEPETVISSSGVTLQLSGRTASRSQRNPINTV